MAPAAKFAPEAGLGGLFLPTRRRADAIIREINQARRSVLVLASAFTSALSARALLRAHQRGVRVEVVLDTSQQANKVIHSNSQNGPPTTNH